MSFDMVSSRHGPLNKIFHCGNIIECTYVNLSGTVYHMTWLQAYTACCCTEPHNIRARRRENYAIMQHQMYEAAASITGHTIYSKLFYKQKEDTKIMIKSILQ